MGHIQEQFRSSAPVRREIRSPPPSPSRQTSKIPEEEIQEEGAISQIDQEDTSPPRNSSSSSDEAVTPPTPTASDDLKQFQELFKRVATNEEIALQEVQEKQHKLLQILQTSVSTKIALSIDEAIMEPAEARWQTPALAPPTSKRGIFRPSQRDGLLVFVPSTQFSGGRGCQSSQQATPVPFHTTG